MRLYTASKRLNSSTWLLPARRYAIAGISRHRISVYSLSVRPSVRLSQAGTVPKRQNVGSRKHRHVIA